VKTLILAVLLAGLTGCISEKAETVAKEPGFIAPFTGVARARTNADNALPSSDGDLLILRGDKFAYGTSAPVSYSIYTYDTQNIGIRNSGGSGYRYRWIIEGP